MQILFQDIRYGLRMLAKNPGFTVVAVLAIALGIGVNAGIFSVLNGAALRMLPVPSAGQIVSVDQIFHGKATPQHSRRADHSFLIPNIRSIGQITMFFPACWLTNPFSTRRLPAAGPASSMGN